MKRFRQFLIRLLSSVEDDLSSGNVLVPPPAGPVTLRQLRDNDLAHHALALNSLHIRVGRLEAKVGMILTLSFMIATLILEPYLSPAASWFMGRVF